MKCPICDTSGLPDFTKSSVICPQCNSEYTYEDGELHICPECAHEWSKNNASHAVNDGFVVKDANGNLVTDVKIGDFEREDYYYSFSLGVYQNTFNFGRILLGYSFINYEHDSANFILPSVFVQYDIAVF